MKTMTSAAIAVLISAFGVLLIPSPVVRADTPVPLREINYYPSDFAWERFWPHWSEARPFMDSDLVRMRSLGANTVRIFVHPWSVGYPQPTDQFTADFEDALALIAAHGLKAHVTLFDCWWSWSEIANSRTWLTRVVQPHRNDTRIALWELQNEVQLDNPDILYYTAQKGIHDLGAWTLNDFPTGTAQCAGNVPSAAEWHFGLYRLDGLPKPATVVLKASFQGHDPIDPAATYVINESFESANLYLEKVENWRSWDQNWSGNQTFVQDCTRAHTGRCSAQVHGFPNLVNGLYSLPILPVRPGQSWALQGYLRTQNLHGWAKIVLSWFNGSQQWLDQDTSSQLISAIDLEEWTKVAIEPTAPPPGAAYVQVFAQVYTTDPATYVWFDDITTQPNKLYMPSLWRRS